MWGLSLSTTVVKTGYERPYDERQWASREGGSRDHMRSVVRARKEEREWSEGDEREVEEDEDGEEGEEREWRLGREEATKERTEAMVKKRRGAAEEEVRREEGEVVEEEREEVAPAQASEEKREEVGSRWFCRWSRFDSITKND